MKLKCGYYTHFKGGYYKVIGIAKDSETLEDMAIYKHIGKDEIWVRPVKMFNDIVENAEGFKVHRFEFCGIELSGLDKEI